MKMHDIRDPELFAASEVIAQRTHGKPWRELDDQTAHEIAHEAQFILEAAALPLMARGWDRGVTKSTSLLWEREKQHKNDQDLSAEIGAARHEIRREANPYKEEA